MILVKSPKSNRVYATCRERETLFTFNGTPLEAPKGVEDWPTVSKRELRCVFDWQRDPGLYGPHWAVVRMCVFPEQAKPAYFTAGGSWVYIQAWRELRKSEGITTGLMPIALYADRQTARDNAEVQW